MFMNIWMGIVSVRLSFFSFIADVIATNACLTHRPTLGLMLHTLVEKLRLQYSPCDHGLLKHMTLGRLLTLYLPYVQANSPPCRYVEYLSESLTGCSLQP